MFIIVVDVFYPDSDIATAVDWTPDTVLFSCSDDKDIYKWSTDGGTGGKVASIDAYITHISWFPPVGKQVISESIKC